MFNTNIADLGSISCGSLEFLESAVDFDDLAFLQMVMCMQESDRSLAAKMQEIRDLNAQKKDLTRDISRLNNALAHSSAEEGDDYVYVEGGLENPKDPESGPHSSDESKQVLEERFNNGRDYIKNLKDWGGITEEQAAHFQEELNSEAASSNLFKRSVVEAKIEELRGKLEDLNSSSSVMMIDLQRLMNKRNEAVQLVSNIESRSHKTAMAIISNFS